MMGLKNFSLFLMAVAGLGTFSWSQNVPDQLTLFRSYNQSLKKNNDEAFKALKSQFENEKNPQMRAKMSFALGIFSFKNGDSVNAARYLGEAINLKTHLDDYAHFYIGLIERDNKDLNGAKLHFQTVQGHQPPSSKEAEAEIQLAQIAKTQSRWSDSFALLLHLEIKHRHDPQYQDIIYNLIEASFQTHHTVEACKAAVKLYSHFPAYTLGKKWGFDLNKVQVEGFPLRCVVTVRDQDLRMDQLLLAGEFDEVQSELAEWQVKAKADPKSQPDALAHIEMQLGQLDLSEGKSKDALGHFQAAQKGIKDNLNLQMLLAKAYAQSDDYPNAVENYLKASQMGPRFSRRKNPAQKALFQAAFLSYQYQNYDGASRIFEEIAAKSSGPFAWDAKWHLAWIRYLKGDFEGAKKEFLDLSHDRHASPLDIEKLTYWRAMAELRDGNIPEAKILFNQLALNLRSGYYTGAAVARLASLTEKDKIPKTDSSPSPNPTGVKVTFANIFSRKPASEEKDSLAADKEVEKLDEPPAEDDESITSQPFELGPPITSLKNSALVERFDRAKDFIDLGFNPWAVNELREIERRTTNRDYLHSLMSEYQKAGDYFRSATIADNVFETERVQAGIAGNRTLWSNAFPQAFARYVISDSKKFGVSSSLIWSIMRGESGYREDIHSSAGAMGLMQLIPPTAKKIAKGDVDDFDSSMLLTADTNIILGTKYLHRLDVVMKQNLPLIIASYNAGPHHVLGWLKDFGDLEFDEFIEHIPYLETRNYVKKVMRNYFVYESLYNSKSSNVLKCLTQKPTFKYDGPKQSSESWDDIK
jgi:soluble lytic murein transglycosylase